jgi:hypothetical protein
LKARETDDIPLVKLTPMLVKMGHHDLTNRVRILLQADVGAGDCHWTDEEIAEALDTRAALSIG